MSRRNKWTDINGSKNTVWGRGVSNMFRKHFLPIKTRGFGEHSVQIEYGDDNNGLIISSNAFIHFNTDCATLHGLKLSVIVVACCNGAVVQMK